MRHLIILVALVAVVGLDLIFVTYAPTAPSALTFALLAFLIMLLSGVAAGSQAKILVGLPGLHWAGFWSWLDRGFSGFLLRLGFGSLIPMLLLLAVSFIPDIDGPLEAIVLGEAIFVFLLVAALALAGAALAFLWPRTGIFEAVLVGGLIVLALSLVNLLKGDAREALQLDLFGQMVLPSVCLLGAWAGLALREIADCHFYRAGTVESEETAPELLGDTDTPDFGETASDLSDAGAVSPAPATPDSEASGPSDAAPANPAHPVAPSPGEDRGR